MSKLIIKPSEAASVLGVPAAKIRKKLRQQQVPYGRAIRTNTPDGRLRFEYEIYVPKLLEYIGLDEWPSEE
jgi:hypothetical protein